MNGSSRRFNASPLPPPVPVRSSAPARGGVVAKSPGVLVDCSLDRLADLAVAELGASIRQLWSP